MDLAGLRTLIGDLTNDPSHDRYTNDQIGTELDNVQDFWNITARIIKDTVSVTLTASDSTYALSNLTGTPIAFTRVTHKGLELKKKDKSYFDLYTGDNWSDDEGTPKYYYIDASDPDLQQIVVYPIPGTNDVTDALVVEYVKRHTPMSATSDTPFNANTLLVPYHHGLAYHVASRLLMRDPSEANALKVVSYAREANKILVQVTETFKGLEREEPYRIRIGRNL